MTLYFATQAYLHDDDLSAILPVTGQAAVDANPLPPCSPVAALENPPPQPPRAVAVAFPLNPVPLPPTGMATLENPAPSAPRGNAVEQNPNPPPKPPKGKAEDV